MIWKSEESVKLVKLSDLLPSDQQNQSFVLRNGFDLQQTLEIDPEFLNTDGEHIHDSSVSCVSITQAGDVDF